MSSPAPLTALADPMALARLQVLLVPVHRDGSTSASEPVLLEPVYEHWSNLFRKHQTLRGDEIIYGGSSGSSAHRRGAPESPRRRFLPSAPGSSISRAAGASHVQLAFPAQPPAKHLYPLSLLRMTAFPLVVIGIGVNDEAVAEGCHVPGGSDDAASKANESAAAQAWTQTFSQTLSSLLPSTSAFPLVKRLVLVPSQLPSNSSRPPARGTPRPSIAGEAQPSFIRYAPYEGGDSWVAKLLGEVVGDVYGELGDLAASLESPAGMKTLSDTLLPSLSTLPEQNSTPRSSIQSPPRESSTPASPSHRSSGMVRTNSMPVIATISKHPTRALTPGGRPTSIMGPSAPPIQSSAIAPPAPSPSSSVSANPFRRSTVLSSPFNRAASAGIPAASKEIKDALGVARYTTAPLTGIAGGRLLKLLGDMYLLTGKYSDAIKCYDEGAEKSRTVGDVLWEALAREGRAVASIGEAWEGRDGSTLSTPFPSSPIPVEILSHYLSALACLSRSPLPFPPTTTILSPAPQSARDSLSNPPPTAPSPTQVGTGEGLLAYLYSTLCIRISHFVLTIFAAGGWGSIAVSSLIAHTLPRSFPPLVEDGDAQRTRSRRLALAQLASQSKVTRHSILGHAEAAVAPFRQAMTKAEQLSIYVEVVRLARWLEMERKEAAATREVVKLVGAVVVEGREEHRHLLSHAAGQTYGGDTSSAALNYGTGVPSAVVARRKETTHGNNSISELIERMCAILGVDLLALGEPNEEYQVAQPSDGLKEPHFGWPELQVEVIKEAITISEALPDQQSVVRLCLSALCSLHSYLSQANQTQLSKLYVQAISTLRRRAIEMGPLPWWLPGRMVLSVEIASLAPNKVPFEHARAEIEGVEKQGAKDPFLYNPRLKAPEPGKTVLVANEQVDVFVTIQNVFAFDLEIQDLSLLTSGSPFITNPLPLVLPASSVQTVRVSGMAPAPGALQVRGVHVRLIDGSSAEFMLPVDDDSERKRDSKRRSRALANGAKAKRQGLKDRKSVIMSSDIVPSLPAADERRWLECNVVEEQPLLWIKKTCLSHGTVMLYDGETSVIRITVENSSQVPVDFVKLSFEDSVTREAQYLLADGAQTSQQAYELDYDVSKQPVFTWDNSSPLSIPPGGRATLSVQVLGKVGCTDGTIRIDYGFVNRAAESTSGMFYTRRLSYPVLFTVYRTLECFALDLASMRNDSQARQRLANGTKPASSTFATSSDEELKRALARGDDRSVLFCLNVSNVFSVPFEVAMTTCGEGADHAPAVTRLVPPGATERLVLPIQRQTLSAEERAQPIPSAGRQYVVDKLKKTKDEQALEREIFWYRERLLDMVVVSWREPSSLRSGGLSLREQPLTIAHVEALRLNEVVVKLDVQPRAEDGPKAMDFVDLCITVTNHLERTMRPYVRLEAIPTSSTDASWSVPAPPPAPRRFSSLPATPMPLPKTVAFDGVLAATLPSLGPGDSASHVVGAILLASGSYTFRAAAEEVPLVPFPTVQPPNVCFSPSISVHVP